jgi:hypothetical protein
LYTAEKLNKNCYDFVQARFSNTHLWVQIGLFEKQFCVGKYMFYIVSNSTTSNNKGAIEKGEKGIQVIN